MDERQFKRKIKTHYKKYGRDFPWRNTKIPYEVFVSEVMLQQTQAERVVEKYRAFLEVFPTLEALAQAPQSRVLKEWQGLGYNRRALNLHRSAIVSGGKLPATKEELCTLPGVGPYTAAAIMNFAYNTATPMVETNIRNVYIHFFFPTKHSVDDKDILKRVEATMDTRNPKEWFNALMDYGVYLKQTYGNANKKSKHYHTQSPFKGSRREVRGAVLRLLVDAPHSVSQIERYVTAPKETIGGALTDLEREGFLIKGKKGRYYAK